MQPLKKNAKPCMTEPRVIHPLELNQTSAFILDNLNPYNEVAFMVGQMHLA